MLDRILDILHGILFSGFFGGGWYFLYQARKQAMPTTLFISIGAKLLFLSLLLILLMFTSFNKSVATFVSEPRTTVLYYMLTAPFCAIILTQLTRECKLTWRMALCHVGLPLSVVLLYTLQWFYQIPGIEITFWVYVFYIFMYSIYYVLRCAMAWVRYESTIGDVYADVKGRSINWLGVVIVMYVLLMSSFFVFKYLFSGALSTVLFTAFCIVFYVVFCYLIGCMRDVSLMDTVEDEEGIRNLENEETRNTDNDESFMDNLRDTIVTQKLYANTDLNRNDVAMVAGTNHLYLTRNIKRITGLTFMQYINDIRLSIAVDMLEDSSLSLDDISIACGYNSENSFYRSFVKKYRQSPSSFRLTMQICQNHAQMQKKHAQTQ